MYNNEQHSFTRRENNQRKKTSNMKFLFVRENLYPPKGNFFVPHYIIVEVQGIHVP
jgi:hypothetical protein